MIYSIGALVQRSNIILKYALGISRRLKVLDLDSIRFDRDPFTVLLHHQILASELFGDPKRD